MSNKPKTDPYEVYETNIALIAFRFKCMLAFGLAITTTTGAYGFGAGFDPYEVLFGCLFGFAGWIVICGVTSLIFDSIEGRVAREIMEDRRNG